MARSLPVWSPIPKARTSVWKRTAGAAASAVEAVADSIAGTLLTDEERLARADARAAAAKAHLADIDRRIGEGDDDAANELDAAQVELAAASAISAKVGRKIRARRASDDSAAAMALRQKQEAAFIETFNEYYHWVVAFDRACEGARHALEENSRPARRNRAGHWR